MSDDQRSRILSKQSKVSGKEIIINWLNTRSDGKRSQGSIYIRRLPMKLESLLVGQENYLWNLERVVLLDVVDSVIGGRRHGVAVRIQSSHLVWIPDL